MHSKWNGRRWREQRKFLTVIGIRSVDECDWLSKIHDISMKCIWVFFFFFLLLRSLHSLLIKWRIFCAYLSQSRRCHKRCSHNRQKKKEKRKKTAANSNEWKNKHNLLTLALISTSWFNVNFNTLRKYK